MDKNRFFRAIPKVDTLIEQCDSAGLFDRYGREITVDCIRERTEALREFIGKSEDETEIIRRTEKPPARHSGGGGKALFPQPEARRQRHGNCAAHQPWAGAHIQKARRTPHGDSLRLFQSGIRP